LITNREADLSLTSLSSHHPAEVSKFGEVAVVLNVRGCHVAMNNDRFDLHPRDCMKELQ